MKLKIKETIQTTTIVKNQYLKLRY